MEEVWMVYLCLILVVLVYILMNRKPDDEIEKKKDPGSAPASSSYSAGSVGRRLECTEEELEQSLERLVRVLSKADARKREAPHDQRESSGRGPSQPQLSQSNVQEKSSHPKSHESLVNEIEQAVQETVDADVYVRRRQAQPAPRSHREVQRPELSEKF